MTRKLLPSLCAFVVSIICVQGIHAQPQTQPFSTDDLPSSIKATFIQLRPGIPSLLYEPRQPERKSEIAIFLMHPEQDYLHFSACTELAKRGYRLLCANSTTTKGNTSLDFNLDEIVGEVKVGVAYLRKLPSIKKIVLLGHSGGGSLMSAYQDIAENGVKGCQGAEKIHRCPDSLADLPPADGLLLLDANWGMGTMMVFSIDPAVTDESNGKSIDESLNLFNPKNGYKPEGSKYSPEFIARFQRAVSARNMRIVKFALERKAAIEAGRGAFADDEVFTVPGAVLMGFNNKLFAEDTHLMSHTKSAWPLVHADGSVTTQIINSVRKPEGHPLTQNLSGAVRGTVSTFLTSFAVRTTEEFGYDEDSVRGIDWTSAYSTTPGAIQRVKAPMLTLGMTGHWEYLAAETIYEMSPSHDKSIAFIEGASHGIEPCKACESTPGEFGDTVKSTYDYVDKWLAKSGRFLE
jgi:hypothetical protein